MTTISITYATYFRLSFAHNYEWTKNGKCFNVNTKREIKQVLNNRCFGYNIKGKFFSLKYLRTKLEKIPIKENPPF